MTFSFVRLAQRFAFALCLATALTTAAHAAPAAPQPAESVDKDQLYIGVWHEVARTKNHDTDGCVAPEARFTTNDNGVLIDRESCRLGDPNTGKLKIVEGPVGFPDPHSAAKFRTSHAVLGLIPVSREAWVLDHDESYTWFIAANPAFTDLSIFTRDPQAPQSLREELVTRAKALGFDVSRLEFPPQPLR
jgi:apolipoprotein D and lipocalin family protein